MADILGTFGEEHEEALDQLANLRQYLDQLREGKPMGWLVDGYEAFSKWLGEALKNHFRTEEEALFPPLKKVFGGGGGPVAQMLYEHGEIEEAHAEMARALAKEAPDREALADASEKILAILPGHIEKEDNVLFPFAARRLTPDQMAAVSHLAETVGKPHGAGLTFP
ncbi:MAG: hemerythrin domain-containing protein [Bacillota bacterium]